MDKYHCKCIGCIAFFQKGIIGTKEVSEISVFVDVEAIHRDRQLLALLLAKCFLSHQQPYKNHRLTK